MPLYFYVWTDKNVSHLAENDVTPEEFEQVLRSKSSKAISRSSGRPATFGFTQRGRELVCIYEFIDDHTILPVTAYELA